MAGGRLRACGPPVEVLTSGLLSEVYQRGAEVLDGYARRAGGSLRSHAGTWDDVGIHRHREEPE